MLGEVLPDVFRQLGREACYQQPQRLVARSHDAAAEARLLLFGWVGFVQCIDQDDDLGSEHGNIAAVAVGAKQQWISPGLGTVRGGPEAW